MNEKHISNSRTLLSKSSPYILVNSKMNNLVVFFTFSLLVSLSRAIEVDFCVADPSLPRGPEGYACRDPATLTADDFVYTGFRGDRTITNVPRNNVTLAFVDAFPALNGLGISMARLDFGVGGVIPVHSHRTSEVIIVARGSIIAGFIDANNTAYYRRLEVGDVMIFPQAMLHFQVNVGATPATAFVSLNGANPAIQFSMNALFAGNLPADIAQQITLLSNEEVMRMKRAFGTA
ncbi:auxin-binding protein ABP19a [Beta vulgaris subsp. vulgaris]|uniref:auxin-binding protein ABP19a n=1 Tax=Beta vulgaris subsp. vulgaris TaxID=3555 RepID=UPI002036A4BF|nr:auxin-binding protein ABP19a [Beta vulgaris subsp. vulgaris]